MQHKLIVDFADLPQNTVERQVNATEQLAVLCGLNRRTSRRLGKMVYLILSNHPLETLIENSIQFVSSEYGCSLGFQFSTHPMPLSEITVAGSKRNLKSLRRAGEKLEQFEIKGSPEDGFEIQFAQSLGMGFEIPGTREMKQWARVIARGNWEEAFERLSNIYASSRSKIQQLRDGISIRRDVLESDKGQTDVILSLVASKTDNSVVILDAQGNIEWVNRAFQKLTGFEVDEQASTLASEILFGDQQDQDAARNRFTKALDEGRNFNIEYSWSPHRDDGSDRPTAEPSWIEFQVTPVRDEDDRVVRWIAIGADVTRRRKAELAMQAARDVAESASKAKSEFLAMMSHEIRTPMNAIIGMTELVLGTRLSIDQREYLTTAQNSAQALLQILNDILDLSKVEADRLKIEQIDFDLSELTKETVITLNVLAAKKELKLRCDFASEIPTTLIGDPGRIRQILVNLVGNAIKFTSFGEVAIEAEMTDETHDRITIHFAVRDTGCGIAEEKISRIFEAFYQTDASVTKTFGGTGLGLAITSELVRLMGGRIWVESKLGKGSAFHFVITLSKSTRKLVDETLAASPAQPMVNKIVALEKAGAVLDVLLVDDHASNRNLLFEIMRRRGHRSQLASSGQEAVELMVQSNFDVVLMDVQMPEQDGLQTTAQIRQLPGSKSLVPIVAVTAYVTEEDRTRCIDAGMDDYLSKPIQIGELLEKVERWGNTRRADHPTRDKIERLDEQLQIQDAPQWATQLAQTIIGGENPESVLERDNDAATGEFVEALTRLGGDVDLLKMQMGFFLQETPQLLKNIHSAIHHLDQKTLHHNAHRLKDLVRSYDDDLATELAMKLEDIGRSGDFVEAESTFSLLEGCVAQLGLRIEAFACGETARD